MSISKYRCVVLGAPDVGKTNIINRWFYEQFDIHGDKDETPDVGVDFLSKTVTVENSTVRLQLWDVAVGRGHYKSAVAQYVRDSDAAIVVYDATDRKSLKAAALWIEFVNAEHSDEIPLYLVGNKIDLHDDRQVPHSDGEWLAEQYGAAFVEVSAKKDINVSALFTELLLELDSSGGGGGSHNAPRAVAPPPKASKKALSSVADHSSSTASKKSSKKRSGGKERKEATVDKLSRGKEVPPSPGSAASESDDTISHSSEEEE